MRPNPSVERTRNGMACLALISFGAKHTTPLRSAYLERYAAARGTCPAKRVSKESV